MKIEFEAKNLSLLKETICRSLDLQIALPEQVVTDILKMVYHLCRKDRKICCIKLCRVLKPNTTLLEAKQYVERYVIT